MVAETSTKRRRNSSAGKSAAKRRRTTKQITFHDDEGDTITFRLNKRNGGTVMSEMVNGKTTLAAVTVFQINEGTGRVVDDDGESDCFRLMELNQLPELRTLAEEAGLTVDWIPKKLKSCLKKTEPASKPVAEEPVMPAPASFLPKTTDEIEEPVKAKKSPKKSPKKVTKRRKRSKSKTPRRKRKPKVWEPIVFEDDEGDKVTFSLTPEGFLQERVNGKVTLAKVSKLSLNTALSRIEDDDGKSDGFNVKETEKLGKLRDMAVHAMDLNLYWSTEMPESTAWCSVM